MKIHLMLIAACLAGSLAGADVAAVAGDELQKAIPQTITRNADNGVLYSRSELEFLTAGELTGARIAQVSKAAKKENADPVPAIVDFDRQLKEQNIKLIVIPVPPKAAALPLPGTAAGQASQMLAPLYDRLRAEGVDVLDLSVDFIAAGDAAYCKTDAHWSPAGIKIAARKVAEKVPFRGGVDYQGRDKSLTVRGDLAKAAGLEVAETLNVCEVSGNVFAENAPVLLLSDSHGLVFSTGDDMLAEHAGFGEQLALMLHSPIDRMAVKGSASTPVRINLYRKAAKEPQWLKDKKVVLWVFSCREFTQSTNGWVKVPVLKK